MSSAAVAAAAAKDEGAVAASSSESKTNIADSRYTFDSDALAKLKQDKPWMNDPKYFQKVAMSPSSVMKILAHCNAGVEKGISKGGRSI